MGNVATSKYDERVAVFERLNQKSQDKVSILPQANYFGKKPDPKKDPFDRRKVKQLNDISFEESSSAEEEGEDIKKLKRLP